MSLDDVELIAFCLLQFYVVLDDYNVRLWKKIWFIQTCLENICTVMGLNSEL